MSTPLFILFKYHNLKRFCKFNFLRHAHEILPLLEKACASARVKGAALFACYFSALFIHFDYERTKRRLIKRAVRQSVRNRQRQSFSIERSETLNVARMLSLIRSDDEQIDFISVVLVNWGHSKPADSFR